MHPVMNTTDVILFALRWIHFLAGITWIGHLYYFNFVQGEFFKEIDAGQKNVAISKLVPKALWWFRWGAMFTFLSGVALITGTYHSGMPLASSWGVFILIGSMLGTLMFLNVWLIIWPNQKKVIASANQVLAGGAALPEAAAAGAKALLASRTNVLFSIPMLYFMGAAKHLGIAIDFSTVNYTLLAAVIGSILLVLEMNAIKGKLGPLTTVKGVIVSGFILTAAIWISLRLVIG